jgi:hypothetical protein
MYDMDMHQVSDSEEWMNILQTELKNFNEGLKLGSTTQELTHAAK